jgi:hypothetical protein
MPRYFFNFERADKSVADLVGRNLTNDDAAKSVAAKLAADLATDAAVEGQAPTFEWIEVVDDCDRAIARLPVRDVFKEPSRLR